VINSKRPHTSFQFVLGSSTDGGMGSVDWEQRRIWVTGTWTSDSSFTKLIAWLRSDSLFSMISVLPIPS
jgi:hypothetical protein